MSVHKGHRQRTREKFLRYGINHMHPHEVLEFLLFHSIPRGDTNEIAHNLIKEFGSFKAVFSASFDQLIEVKGIGETSASLILFFMEAFRYYETEITKDIILDNTESVGYYLLSQFSGKTRENVMVVCLDSKCKMINTINLGEGTVNASTINVRKVIEIGIRNNAAGIVLAHNHPGGVALPSKEDASTTNKIQAALELINVKLVDHIVVADGDFVSFKQSGMIF